PQQQNSACARSSRLRDSRSRIRRVTGGVTRTACSLSGAEWDTQWSTLTYSAAAATAPRSARSGSTTGAPSLGADSSIALHPLRGVGRPSQNGITMPERTEYADLYDTNDVPVLSPRTVDRYTEHGQNDQAAWDDFVSAVPALTSGQTVQLIVDELIAAEHSAAR